MTEEAKKGFSWGKGCLIVIGVIVAAFVGLIVLGAIVGGKGGSSDKSGSADSAAPTEAAMEVSAKELSAAFQQNEAKAKLAFDDKTLKVSGKVKDIDLDFADEPVIRLAGAGDVQGMGISQGGKMTDVSVHGLSKDFAAQINKGDSLTVVCKKVDEVLGGPQLNDCAAATPAK